MCEGRDSAPRRPPGSEKDGDDSDHGAINGSERGGGRPTLEHNPQVGVLDEGGQGIQKLCKPVIHVSILLFSRSRYIIIDTRWPFKGFFISKNCPFPFVKLYDIMSKNVILTDDNCPNFGVLTSIMRI